jgi:outer membrane protein assembly factor BamD
VSRHFGKTILLSAFLAAAASCATTDEGKGVTYSLTAKQNYDKGLEELKDENYAEAARFFSFVRQKFPFSKYAVLAELALADTQYERGNYQEAIDAYKTFLRLHPTHEKVEDGYVAYRIGECYTREMPDDFFLLPPAYEKDQTAVRDALRELADFIDKYPDSKYLPEAKKQRREVLRRLIEHEVYVARFYLDRDFPKAAILRLEGALRRYPDSGREPELLLALGETHLQMGNAARAKQAFGRVVTDYGTTHQAKRAELFLDFIKRRHGEVPKDKPAEEKAEAKPTHG